MRKISIILSIVLFAVINLHSQGGSNYSVIGIGDINNIGNAEYGGTGVSIAMDSKTGINQSNPALWSKVRSTRLQMGYLFNQNLIQNGNQTLWQNNGNVTGFAAIFNMDTASGFSVSIGLNRRSSVAYYIATPIEINENGLDITGTSEYRGSGGLNKIYFGFSYKPLSFLSIGLETNYTFGTIDRSSQTLFFSDYSIFSPQIRYIDYYNGAGGKLGINIDVTNNLAIAGFYSLAESLDLKRTTVNSGINAQTDSIRTQSLTQDIPQTIGVGLSYKIKKWNIGADYVYQDFSDFNTDVNAKTQFNSAQRFAIGLSYLPKSKLSRNYFDNITYRLGFAYSDLYYTIKENAISELSLSYGMQIPTSGTMNFDIAFILGTRGTTESNLVREDFFRMAIDMSIGELWFKPSIRDYDAD